MKTDLIYINLGDSCNFSCKYCMSHNKPALNKNIDLQNLFKNIHTLLSNEHKTLIRFYGGEPLLYFNIMKQITEEFKNYNAVTFNCPTNGSLLTNEIVNYLNSINFCLSISHDGEGTKITRNIDVLDDIKIINLLKNLNNYSFISVINKYSKSAYSCWNYIEDKIKEKKPMFFVPVYPSDNNIDEALLKVDFDLLLYESKLMVENYYKNCFQERIFINHLIEKYSQAKQHECIDKTCFCNKLYHNYHFNLNGERLDCCTCRKIVDEQFLQQHQIEHYNKLKNNNCLNCNIYPLCRGGCDLVVDKYRDIYCKTAKSIYAPFVKTVVNGIGNME